MGEATIKACERMRGTESVGRGWRVRATEARARNGKKGKRQEEPESEIVAEEAMHTTAAMRSPSKARDVGQGPRLAAFRLRKGQMRTKEAAREAMRKYRDAECRVGAAAANPRPLIAMTSNGYMGGGANGRSAALWRCKRRIGGLFPWGTGADVFPIIVMASEGNKAMEAMSL